MEKPEPTAPRPLDQGDTITVKGSRPLEVIGFTVNRVLVVHPVGTLPGVIAVKYEDIDDPK